MSEQRQNGCARPNCLAPKAILLNAAPVGCPAGGGKPKLRLVGATQVSKIDDIDQLVFETRTLVSVLPQRLDTVLLRTGVTTNPTARQTNRGGGCAQIMHP